ncbi:uncharacterized protein LOC101898714 [Musca domestica]|uniref:Cell wall protein DAN4 n=1 Tax=Musca domestica TaxID=7370 RepID=A0A1I8N565_MUSDO|nr:uncharacterized protein LOC101898714 [Musca domestica]
MEKVSILLFVALMALSVDTLKADSFVSDTLCYSKADGTLLRISDTCSSYIYCLSQKALTINCPSGMGFSSMARGCVQYSQSDCANEKSNVVHFETQSSVNTDSTADSTFSWSICYSQRDGASFPIKGDCRMFIYCLAEMPLPIPCLFGKGYSTALGICVPYDQSDCVITSTTSTTVATSSSTSDEYTTLSTLTTTSANILPVTTPTGSTTSQVETTSAATTTVAQSTTSETTTGAPTTTSETTTEVATTTSEGTTQTTTPATTTSVQTTTSESTTTPETTTAAPTTTPETTTAVPTTTSQTTTETDTTTYPSTTTTSVNTTNPTVNIPLTVLPLTSTTAGPTTNTTAGDSTTEEPTTQTATTTVGSTTTTFETTASETPVTTPTTTSPLTSQPTIPPITTPTTPNPSLSILQELCKNKTAGSHVPYPYDDTEYVICPNPSPEIVKCPTHSEYDPKTGQCKSDIGFINMPHCLEVAYGQAIPFIGDCTKYYLCFGKKAMNKIWQCEVNWLFNAELASCVPQELYQCPW